MRIGIVREIQNAPRVLHFAVLSNWYKKQEKEQSAHVSCRRSQETRGEGKPWESRPTVLGRDYLIDLKLPLTINGIVGEDEPVLLFAMMTTNCVDQLCARWERA